MDNEKAKELETRLESIVKGIQANNSASEEVEGELIEILNQLHEALNGGGE